MDASTLIALLAKIPAAFWGTLTGFALAIVPVLISNRHSRKLQRQQLDFESIERQRERHASLRRDVYLPAADSVTAALAGLVKMLNDDRANDVELSAGAQELGTALTRVQMVATGETVRLAAEFHRVYLSVFTALMKRRYPMMLRKADIEIANASRQRHHEERLECVELMKEYNLSGAKDPQRRQQIRARQEHAGKLWREEHGQWMRFTVQQEADRHALIGDLVSWLSQLSRVQGTLMVAIRRELGVSEDATLLLEQIEITATEGVRALNELIPMIERGLDGLRSDLAEYEAEEGKALTPPPSQ
ncbi:MAG TPA: hypothetical protein VGN07_09020 [Steroidobacteraceae bacterium]